MEFRTLKYFLAVAQEESITKAANILHITQPTLSRQMNDLEEELGTRLFVRTNRNTMLSEDGIVFKQRTIDLVNLMEKAENEFKHDSGDIYGDIHIGSIETESMDIVIETIRSLVCKYPGIKYHFYNGNSDELIARLDAGLLDFCLIFGRINEERYEKLTFPHGDSTGILTVKDSPYANLPGVTLTELRKMKLIISSRLTGGVVPIEGHHDVKIDLTSFDVIGTFTQIHDAKLMVRAGICNAVSVGRPGDAGDKGDLAFIPFVPDAYAVPAFIWKKSQIMPQANRIFIDAISAKIKNS
ncbi:MAG: LysR family transcriptional regulator [Erysipelotrichaceae bacterium]|nr:LysR family transcriptional regulator [Erysipelotrichaceae bacterium]